MSSGENEGRAGARWNIDVARERLIGGMRLAPRHPERLSPELAERWREQGFADIARHLAQAAEAAEGREPEPEA